MTIKRTKSLRAIVLAAAATCIGPLWAQTTESVLLAEPMAKTNAPQTPAEEEHGKQFGRTLPALELLRPALDPTLEDFKPRLKKDAAGTFRGASSDVGVLLFQNWVKAFQKYYPKAELTIAPPYAGSLGAKELINGKIQFVVVSRELKPDDLTEFRAKFHYDPLSVPVSGGSYRHFGFLDAVVFFVNPANPVDHLSFEQLDRLYSKTHHRGGEAPKTWGELGATGEFASHPIHLYGIKPWNGFEEFVRQRALSTEGKRGEWQDSGITYDKLVFPAAARVASDPDGIDFAGLAFVDHPVKILGIAGESGPPVYPTYTNVANASYPLSRVIYFNTNKVPDQPLDPLMAEFLRFVLSRQGQQVVLDEGIYMPLREFQVKTSVAMVK